MESRVVLEDLPGEHLRIIMILRLCPLFFILSTIIIAVTESRPRWIMPMRNQGPFEQSHQVIKVRTEDVFVLT